MAEWAAGAAASAADCPADTLTSSRRRESERLRRLKWIWRFERLKIPPDLEAIWKRMCSPRSVIAEFAKLKEAIAQVGGAQGETAYQEILGRHGVARPSEFKRSQPARLCAKEVFQALESFKQTGDSVPDVRVDETAANDEHAREAAVAKGE